MSNAKTATEKYVDDAIAAAAVGGGTDTVAWDNVTDKPTFSTVATSGSYNDLLNKPTIPDPVDISGKVDKEDGKGLSSNDYTDAEKAKVEAALTEHQDISNLAEKTELRYGLVTKTASGSPATVALQDRAVNAVSLTADATLLPPAAVTGKARDLIVRLTLTETNNTVPSPAFDASVDYETEGGASLNFSEAGTYVVRITETKAASGNDPAVFLLQASKVAEPTPVVSAGGGS